MARRSVYFWADDVYFTPRLDEDRQCMLVIIGADEWGNKDVLGLVYGFHESTQSWRELPLDLKLRWLSVTVPWGEGMTATDPKECPKANVLNAMPKSLQPKAHLKDIWMAKTKAGVEAAFDFFVEAYGVKYDRAMNRRSAKRNA